MSRFFGRVLLSIVTTATKQVCKKSLVVNDFHSCTRYWWLRPVWHYLQTAGSSGWVHEQSQLALDPRVKHLLHQVQLWAVHQASLVERTRPWHDLLSTGRSVRWWSRSGRSTSSTFTSLIFNAQHTHGHMSVLLVVSEQQRCVDLPASGGLPARSVQPACEVHLLQGLWR